MSDDDIDVWDAVKTPKPKAPLGFRVIKGNKLEKSVRLEMDTTYLGRMPENHIVLDDPTVSRSHACVLKRGDDYYLVDQDSENGIVHRGKKVKEVKLKLGEQVEMGSYKLEVISATDDITTEKRIDRMDESQEEWHMDKTMVGNPADLAKMRSQPPAKKPEKGTQPQVVLQLKIGTQEFVKDFVLSQGRERKVTDDPSDFVEMRIGIGKWILYKKEPL